MKNIDKILASNPSLAKEMAKLLREELDMGANDTTDLTLPTEPVTTNDKEVTEGEPNVDVNNADVLADGHQVDLELTDEDPVTEEELIAQVDEIPVEELEDEVAGLEEVKEEDEEKIEELEEVIQEATRLIESYKKRTVFTESLINRVNARILTEAAKVLAGRASLTESKK